MTTKARREREKQARREEILNAAQRLFAREGFHATRLDDIAEEAELSKGTIYLYFNNKEDLFLSLVQQRLSQLMDRLRRSVEAVKPALEKISRLVHAYLSFFEENGDFFRIIHSESTRFSLNIRDEQRRAILDRYREYVDFVTAVIAKGKRAGVFKGINSQAIALSLIGLLHSFTFNWILYGDGDRLVSKGPLIIHLFLNGVGK